MAIERVNLNFDGGQSTEAAGGAMSADGRYVVFISADKDILGGPERGAEVYLRDMQTGENYLISRGYNGDTDGNMYGVGVSGDGRYVVYGSNADNIVQDDSDGLGDIFVYDRVSGVTKMLSDTTEYDAYFTGAVATNGSSIAYWEDRGYSDRIIGRSLTSDAIFYDSAEDPLGGNLTFNVWGISGVSNAMANGGMYARATMNVESASYYTNESSYSGGVGHWVGPYGKGYAWNQQFNFGAGGATVALGVSGGFSAELLLYNPAPNYSNNAVTFNAYGAGGWTGRLYSFKNHGGKLIKTVEGAVSDNGHTAFFASNLDFKTETFIGGWGLFAWDTRTGSYDGGVLVPGNVVLIAHAPGAERNPFEDVRSSANGRYVTFSTTEALVDDDTNGSVDIYRVENPIWDGTTGSEGPPPEDAWIKGTPGDDVLLGTAKDDRMDGLAGDDDIEGAKGDDEIYGREGDDQIWGGEGDDEIEGGDGKDVIAGDYGDNAAGGGGDVLSGNGGDDIIHGETGDDKLWGDDGDDALYGDDGKDALVGGAGDDKLYGGKGDDKLTGGEGSDQISGGDESEGLDRDIVIYEGSPDDYTLLDSYSPQRKDYTTTVSAKTGDDVDTVMGVERAQFEHLAKNAVDAQTAILTLAQAANTAYHDTADLGRGWRALSALELGIRSAGEFGDNIYSYKNGAYSALADTAIPGVDPVVGANAQVYFGVVDGKNTLMLAFRGTDEIPGDFVDYPKFALHYARFQPLVDAVLSYVASDGYNTGGDQIEQVMVSGHSLGGAMVQMFMQDARVKGDPLYTAATFGSPGTEKHAADPRIIHVEHTADIVPLAGDAARLGAALTFPALAQLLAEFDDNPTMFRTSGGAIRVSLQEDNAPLTQHSMDHYQDTAARIDDQHELLAKLGYTGSPGSVFNLVVGSRGQDDLEGSNPLLVKVLRGLDYFDGSEVFLSGQGADTVAGGAGDDVFAGYADDLDSDLITDFGDGDTIKIFNFTGSDQVVYGTVGLPGDMRELNIGGDVMVYLRGWHPGEFKLAIDAQGVATVTYVGLFSRSGGDDDEAIAGGRGDDEISGGGGDDQLSGGGGGDRLAGGLGSDRLEGGAGDDIMFGGDDPQALLDGGAGFAAAKALRGVAAPAEDIDTAIYEGTRSQYRAEISQDGKVTIVDLRAGSPEGVDTLHDFEAFQFADKTYSLAQLMEPIPSPGGGGGGGGSGEPGPNPGQGPQVVLAELFSNAALGAQPDAATERLLQALTLQVEAGTLSKAKAMRQVADLQDATTAVAVQTYQFFSGMTPSADGLRWLVHSPANEHDLNDPYFAAFNQESRYINFSVNLATASSSADGFAKTYAKLTLGEVIDQAYDEIIGQSAATAAGIDVTAAHAYLGRAENIDFLHRLVSPAADADLFVKAAIIGQILSIGAGTTFGAYSAASAEYIVDLMDGGLASAEPVNLVGRYGPSSAAGLSWEAQAI